MYGTRHTGTHLSAIAGYFATFASVAPNSRFPYKESHKTAKLIQEIDTPESQLCPFCLMFSLDKLRKESIAKDCDHCSLLLNLRKEPSTQARFKNLRSGNRIN